MTTPSPFAWACMWAVVVPGAIAVGAAGQATTQTEQRPPVWSIHVDPARQPATTQADSAQNRADVAATRIVQTTKAWTWGELLAGRTYRGALTLSNQCKTDVRVGIFAYGLPDLLIPPTATIPAGRTIGMPYRITPTSPTTASDGIRGEVVVWLPPGADPNCPAFRLVHAVSGRARAATANDDVAEKAMVASQRLAEACVQWWLIGQQPAGRTEAECVPIVRRAAIRTRQLLEREASAINAAVSRLPAIEAIGQMSMTELRALRRDFAAALGPSKQ